MLLFRKRNSALTTVPADCAAAAMDASAPADHVQSQTQRSAARDRKVGLKSWNFFGLMSVQFLTSLNDNSYRWLLTPIGYRLIGMRHKALVLTLGLAVFVIPYILLAAPAGFLADRYSKRRVISGAMLTQAAILILGAGALLTSNAYFLYSVLALMGAQGALLYPSKNGTIPEAVHDDLISNANGLLGVASVLSSVVGSILGNTLFLLTAPLGKTNWWISACTLIGISLLGWAASLLIIKKRPANPTSRPPTRVVRRTAQELQTLKRDRRLLGMALAASFFWFLAALAQVNVYLLGTTTLHISQEEVGILLALLALGVAIGSILAGLWSGDRVEPGIIPIGAAGIAGTSFTMYIMANTGEQGSGMFFWNAFVLFWMGLCSGLYAVPLEAYLQRNSPRPIRGQILAATNFLSFGAMLVAAGLFWLLGSALQQAAADIFLLAGVASAAVFGVMTFYLHRQIFRALGRPIRAMGKLLRMV